MDFNIIVDNCGVKDLDIDAKLKKAFELGYETVAINTIVDSRHLMKKNVNIPEPKTVDIKCSSGNKRLKILNRLTGIVSESSNGHHLMQSATAKKYDIISVRPVGEKMTQHVCSNLDVDIVSLDLTEHLGFSLKRTYLYQATAKGVVFEINYSPCLRDQTARRNVISNAQKLTNIVKYTDIIISSEAWKTLELRGVSDVVNLCHLFGLRNNECVAAVRANGLKVLKHSNTRNKTGSGYVSVREMFKLAHQDRWLINACTVPRKPKVEACEEDDDVHTEPTAKKAKLSEA